MEQTKQIDIETIVIEQSQRIRTIFGESDTKRDESLTDPKGIIEFRDILYDENNLMDIYMPEENDKRLPVIVNVHGGAYVYGSKSVYKYYGMFFAEQGFVFVNADYRLAPEYKFPTQLGEICHVFGWMEENAEEYSMDLNNVFLVGDSAGAQMASQLGVIYSNKEYASKFNFTISNRIHIRAMALNCGMYDLLELAKIPRTDDEFMDNYVIMEGYLGKEGRSQEDKLDVCGNIKKGYPPCFVTTSYYDFLRDYAEPFCELLTKKGIAVEYRLYGEEGQEYMGHVFHCNLNLQEAKQCNSDECNFFKKYIKNGGMK